MRPDPGQQLLDDRIRDSSVEDRTAWLSEKRRLGLQLVWQQADAAEPMSELERADFILRRLYPEMPARHLEQILEQLAARWDEGTWHGFARPAGPVPRGRNQLGGDPDHALGEIARRLNWWQPPATSLERPDLLIARIMALGSWADVQTVRARFGAERMQAVLRDPPAGIFDRRSWDYWHAVFGDEAPPLPGRRL